MVVGGDDNAPDADTNSLRAVSDQTDGGSKHASDIDERLRDLDEGLGESEGEQQKVASGGAGSDSKNAARLPSSTGMLKRGSRCWTETTRAGRGFWTEETERR